MRKHILLHKASAFMLSLMMILSNMAPAVAYAMEEDSRDDFYEYELTKDGYKVSKLTDKGRDRLTEDNNELVLPDVHNGIPVIGTKKNAFKDENIKKLFIPSTYKDIERSSFENAGIEKIEVYPSDESLILDSTGVNSFKGNHIEELPFVVRKIKDGSFKGNNLKETDLSYTEEFGKNSFTNNKEIKPIVNKYAEMAEEAFDEETEISYTEVDFLDRQEEDNVDYLRQRENLLKTEREVKTKENEEEQEEEKEDNDNYEVVDKKKTLDEILEESGLEEPKELNKKEYKMLRDKHQAPDRLSFNLIKTAYADEQDNPVDKDDVRIENIVSKWILGEEDGNRHYGEGLQTYKWHEEREGYVRTVTDIALSGQKDHDIGTVQITVPKYLFKDRNGETTGKTTLGVSHISDRKGTFAYLDAGDNYQLINIKPLPAASNVSFEMTYRELEPHMIKDMVTGYKSDIFQAKVEVLTKKGEPVSQVGNELQAQIDTRAYIESPNKQPQKIYDGEYPNDWPEELKPENPEDYIFIGWKTYAVNRGSQPFKVDLVDNAHTSDYTKGAKILGIRRDSDMTMVGKGDERVEVKKIYPEDKNKETDFVKSGRNFYATVYTAYPKSNFFDDNGKPLRDKYMVENDVTYTLTSVDDKEVTEVTARGEVEFLPKEFPTPAPFYNIKKEGDGPKTRKYKGKNIGEYEEALNNLNRGKDTDVSYDIRPTVLGEKFTKPDDVKPFGIRAYGRKDYTSVLTDDKVVFDGMKLEKDDYQFNSITVNDITLFRYTRQFDEWWGYRLSNNAFIGDSRINPDEWAYTTTSNPRKPVEAIVKDQDGKEVAKITYNGEISVKALGKGKVENRKIIFPENTTSYSIETTSRESGYRWHIKPEVKIKATDRVVKHTKQKFDPESDEDIYKNAKSSLFVDNTANLTLKEDKDVKVEDTGRNELFGEYYSEAYPEGHFMMFKWGDGEEITLPDGSKENLAKYLDKTTNSGKKMYKGIYPHHLNKLQRGEETEVYYQLETDAFGMPWTYDAKVNQEFKKNNPDRKEDFVDEAFNQKSYTVTSRDDEVFFDKDRHLTNEDFEFTKIRLKDATIWDYKKFEEAGYGLRESNQTRFNGVIRGGYIAKGDYGYVVNEDINKRPTFEIYGKGDNDTEYTKYGEIKFTSKDIYDIKAENGATNDDTFLYFPKNTTAYKVVATTKLDGLRWAQEPHVKLKQSDYNKELVKGLFEKSDAPFTQLKNRGHLDLVLNEADSKDVVNPIGVDELRGISYKETPPGNHFAIEKEGFGEDLRRVDPKSTRSKRYGQYSMFLNRIMNNDKNAEISYKVRNRGFGMPYTYDEDKDILDPKSFNQVPYTMESRDFFVSFRNEELNKDDFAFTGVKFEQPTIYDYVQYTEDTQGYYEGKGDKDWAYFQHLGGDLRNTNDRRNDYIRRGQFGYKVTKDYKKLEDFEIWAASDDENYKKYGTVSFKTGEPVVTPENGATATENKDEIRFPEEDNITNYKVIAKTKIAGLKWTHEPKVRIKNSEKISKAIDKLYEESTVPEVDVENKVDLNVKLGKEETNHFINEDKGFDRLDGMVYGTSTYKDLKYNNDPVNQVIHLDYFLTTKIQTNIQTKEDLDYAIKNGGFVPETKAVFYDLLPKEVKADLSSIQTTEGDVVTHAEVKENYRDSGRDLLVVEVKRTPKYRMESEKDSITGQKGLMDMPSIRFKANYTWSSVFDLGRFLDNHSIYRSNNPNFGNMKGFRAENNDPNGNNNDLTRLAFTNRDGSVDEETKKILKDLDVDTPNVKGKGNSYLYAHSGNNLIVDVSSSASLQKTVDATGTGVFDSGTEEDREQNVYERQKYVYKKSLKANSESKVTNLIFFDKLEGYEPTADKIDHKDVQWKGTFLGVDTKQLEDKGVNPVLYYSTRKDIVVDNTRDRSMNDISNKEIWTKWEDKPADLDKRDITAIALDARKKTNGEDFVLEEGQSFSYYVHMLAPNLSEDKADNGKPYTKDDQEEKEEWYDKLRKPVDRDLKKVKVLTGVNSKGEPVYDELVFENIIYESEEGLNGGAHAYNNIVATLDSINVNSGIRSKNQLIRHDYTKVGLKPHRLQIEKQWDDDNNRDGIRPEVINVTIKANGKEWKKVQLKKEDDWKLSLLAPYGDNEGKEITYTFEEEVPEGYKFQIKENKPNKEGREVKLENYHEPEKVEIGINKTWTDREEQDEADRPEEVEVVLFDKETKEEIDRATVKVDENGDWKHTFTNLPKYKDEGKEITYEIKEANVVDYISTVEDEEFKDNKKTVKINNRFYPYGDLVVSKKIENGSQLAIDENEFKFTLNITKDKEEKSDRFVGDYKAQKYDFEGNKVGKEITVTDGSEFTLKNNEKMVIKDIDSRFEYKITESETKAFTATSGNILTGRINPAKESDVDFLNRYETEGQAVLNLKKTLDGRDLKGYDFRFKLFETTDGQRTEVFKNPVANDRNGNIRFTLDYNSKDLGTDKNGLLNHQVVKTYEVEEVDEEKNDKDKYGFFYDKKKIFVKITLTDDGHGNINTEVEYNKEGLFNKDDTAFTFNNKYRADREYQLEAFKHVLDGIKIKENQFEFTLKQVGVYSNKDFIKDDFKVGKTNEYEEKEKENVNFSTKNNGKIVSRAFSNVDGKAVFDKYNGKPFVFNQYDIGKTFVFDIDEVDNSKEDDRVIFDKFTVRRYVSVYDGGLDKETNKGTLQIDESTEYIIDESSLDKAKEGAKAIIEKYRRDDAESIIKKIDNAKSIEDVKKVLNETEGLFPLFSNKYKPGDIKVSKKVENGDPQNPGKEFKFRIKLKSQDSKVPDGSLEMKRQLPGYIPAPGMKIKDGAKDTSDGFEFDVKQENGVDNVEIGQDDKGHYVSWDYGLTEGSPYDESRVVKFYGELSPDKMKVTSIYQDDKEKNLDTNKNINEELQNLTPDGKSFNDATNWLVFNDNGKEKLVSKKPLKYGISWNQLYNAGVVFDKDGADNLDDADFTHSNYNSSYSYLKLKDYNIGKGTPKTYKPTYVTLNNKKYIVRLMRAYNEKVKINDNKSWGSWDSNTTKSYVKGSEWNRLLLPLIKDGRYGSNTEGFVEDNMPTLANYSWYEDFGGSQNGYHRWMQETGYDGAKYRASRGRNSSGYAAASANGSNPSRDDSRRGWLPVLEEVKDDSVVDSTIKENVSVASSEKTFMKKAYAAEQEELQKSEAKLSDGTTPVWEVTSNSGDAVEITFRNEKNVLNIEFDANGGQGSMKDLEYDNNLPEGPEVKFYKPNYRFTGWKFYTDNTKTKELTKDQFPEKGKIIAEAQWEKRNLTVNFQNGVGYFTLLAGEDGKFENLPANMDYEIEELTDEQWYNENPAYKDLSEEEKQKLISSDAGWTLTNVENNKGKVKSDETIETQFTNDFQAGKTKVNIEGLKTLNNKTIDTEGYSFSLYESDESLKKANKLQTVTSDENGRFKFEDITYNLEELNLGENQNMKSFYYRVLENDTGKQGIEYNQNFHDIRVDVYRVEENGQVLLQAKVNYLDNTDGQLVINNTTEKTNLTIKKDFKDEKSRKVGQDKEYTVQVRLSDRVNPEVLKLNKDNNFIATIENLELGTTYEVIETDIPGGFKQSDSTNAKGTTKSGTNEVVIENQYVPKGIIELTANKELTGRKLQDNEFKFQLFENGKAISDVVTNTSDGETPEPNKVTFEVPVDKVGTRNFEIREVNQDDKTVNYDKPVKVTVEVTDDGTGNLIANKVEYEDNRDTFTNTLKPGNLQITKTVTNLLNTDQRFTVKVKFFDKKDKELTKAYKYTSNKTQNEQEISSGQTLSLGADETITIQNLPAGTRYEVEEVNIPDKFERTSQAVEGGTIELDKTAEVQITNKYDSEGQFYLRGRKELTGKELEDKEFSFALLEVKPKGQGYRPDEIKYFTNDKDGNIEIGPVSITRDELVMGKDENGKEILNTKKKYRVIETKSTYDENGKLIKSEDANIKYDNSSYEVEVELAEENGKIKVVNQTITKDGKEVQEMVFKNEYIDEKLTSIKIGKKIVNEKENIEEAPKFGIRVKLTDPDGKETVVRLDLANGEEHTIKSLRPGTQYEIEEISMDEAYRQRGITAIEVEDENNTQSVFTTTEGRELTNGVVKGTVNEQQVHIKVENERKPQRVQLRAEKLLDDEVTDKQFEFTLTEEGSDIPLQTVKNKRKLIDFDEIVYEDGFKGPKTYLIREVENYNNDVVYDRRTFKAVVSEKEGSDELEVKYYDPDGKEVEVPVFENRTTNLPKTGRNVMLIILLLILVSFVGKYYLNRKRA